MSDTDRADPPSPAAVEPALKMQAGTVLAREVERLRRDVREWERQFAGLGVAAGRGEPLDTAAAEDLTAPVKATCHWCNDHVRLVLDTHGLVSEPEGEYLCDGSGRTVAAHALLAAAVSSPVREPAPADTEAGA